MEVKEKNKKSLVKRILKWSGIAFLLIIVALILVPIFFKDEIKGLVIDEVNKSLNAKLSMGDFDLTFISTFPNMTIELNDTKLEGINQFKGVELASIKQFVAHVGFWSVVSGDQVEIDEIHLIEPSFDVRVLKNGLANYDIVKPDSVKTPEEAAEPSNFKLSLKEYSISNAKINYDDQASDMELNIQNLNHSGKGDLSADIVDFETTTTMDKMTFEMDGVSYLTDVKTDFIINLLMEFTEKTAKFTLKENQLKLNALTFSIDGFYEMLESHDNMDLRLNASKATFKDFLSLIPLFYRTGYEGMVTKGTLAMGGEVKGILDDKNLPGWDFRVDIDKASIQYAGVPGSIRNIAIKAASAFTGGENLDKMILDVTKFHADFVGNTLDATLKMRNPISDPLLIAAIKAKMDLSTIPKVIPFEKDESLKGKLNADVSLNGRMSSIDKGDYEAFKAQGTLELMELLYRSKGLNQDVSISSILFRFSPKNLSLEKLSAKTGNSDFQMNGAIDNYMGYIFRDELLEGTFNFTSTNLDLDQLMNIVPSSEATVETASNDATTEKAEPILLPDNIDFTLTTAIQNMRYNGIDVKNISGKVSLKEEVATLENLNLNALGGNVGLNGKFSTQNPDVPKIDFTYDLNNIDVKQLSDNFLTIEKMAPITKHTTGAISSTLQMKSSLLPSLEPIYSTLSGSGDLSTKSITISGYKPMQKLSEALKISKLATQTFKDVRIKFSFENGKVAVKPFDVNLGKIKTTISGTTSFEQDIDYDLKMQVPKEEIPAAMIKTVESAISQVSQLTGGKLNLASIPDVIPVKVGIGGKVTDPKITTNFKESIMEATGNLKDNLLNQVKETLKDTVKAIVNEKIEEVKEDLSAKKKELLDQAQREADKIKAEGKKAGDAIRAQADKEAQNLLKQAGANPLKKKAAEIAGDKLRKEADEEATKLEKQANVKADKIMADARAKADQLK